MITFVETAFWIVATLLAYIHVGYPALMWLLASSRKSQGTPAAHEEPSSPVACSVILCVHNEALRIRARIRNLLDLDWPGPWELVLVCDGCTDATADEARAVMPQTRVVSLPTRVGKAAALNAGFRAAQHEVLLFCDARQTFDRGAVGALLAPFSSPEVGAVSGSLEIAASDSGGGQGIDVYWRLERRLREWEGQFDSVVGCTGAIYACRRDLYSELPEDTLLDDVVIPMRVAKSGRRVLFVAEARALDPQKLKPELEARRKLRTLVGNYQMLLRYPQWMLPWRCRLWWQLISHKYLRLLVPWLLLALLGLSLTLSGNRFYLACAAGQVLLCACGLLGMALPVLRGRLFTVTAGFLVLQLASARALAMYLACRGDMRALWPATSPRSAEAAQTETQEPSEDKGTA